MMQSTCDVCDSVWVENLTPDTVPTVYVRRIGFRDVCRTCEDAIMFTITRPRVEQ